MPAGERLARRPATTARNGRYCWPPSRAVSRRIVNDTDVFGVVLKHFGLQA